MGLVSQDGTIPIAHSQDTAGPMCRTVTDVMIMLGVMQSPFGPVSGVLGDPVPEPVRDRAEVADHAGPLQHQSDGPRVPARRHSSVG